MLYTFLLVLLLIDSALLVAAILLQSGKGGGLAASFGGASSSADSLIGSRQAGNLLTKASWWCGGIFLFLAFVLQIASARARTPTSVLDKPFSRTPASAPAPAQGNPAVPLAPANPPAGKQAEQPPAQPKR
jgi:preprotein translocase subunit SecG